MNGKPYIPLFLTEIFIFTKIRTRCKQIFISHPVGQPMKHRCPFCHMDSMLEILKGLSRHGPLARYVKMRVAHAPGMPGTFSPPPRVSDPGMRHGTCVTHVPWCMLGSLTRGFLWSRWWGKRSRHSRRMRNPEFYVSGKRPIARLLEVHYGLYSIYTTAYRV